VINVWGVGLVASITRLAVRLRRLGPANYTVAALLKILAHRPQRLRLAIDGEPEEEVLCDFLTLSNSRFTGGRMELAPPVRVDDGRLFLVCPQVGSRLALLRLFPSLFRGDHLEDSRVRSHFVRQLEVLSDEPLLMNIDGELELGIRPSLRLMPAFWKLLI
jgi:diacylglycerol kinase (ATP)